VRTMLNWLTAEGREYGRQLGYGDDVRRQIRLTKKLRAPGRPVSVAHAWALSRVR
jgi:hypothetical protein